MLRAYRVIRHGEPTAGDVADTVVLDHDERQRRRIKMTGKGGLSFLLDLDRPVGLGEGDGLVLEDGSIVRVVAAAEDVIDVEPGERIGLARIAWHLGNRHCPTEILDDRLRIRRDHVLAAMLEGLGAKVTVAKAPFRPEAGAYDHHGHHHEH
ncbi:MAG: urease accessory protein UreE [Pseudomonadota bacterium]